MWRHNFFIIRRKLSFSPVDVIFEWLQNFQLYIRTRYKKKGKTYRAFCDSWRSHLRMFCDQVSYPARTTEEWANQISKFLFSSSCWFSINFFRWLSIPPRPPCSQTQSHVKTNTKGVILHFYLALNWDKIVQYISSDVNSFDLAFHPKLQYQVSNLTGAKGRTPSLYMYNSD